MAKIIIMGAGLVGLGTAMLLAEDGYEVTVLERDPAAPPPPGNTEEAWEHWERRGVNQFHLGHFLLARYRAILSEDLPKVKAAIVATGALEYNPFLEIPPEMRGEARATDEEFTVLTGRRPIVEAAVAAVADETANLEVRRGTPVEGLVIGKSAKAGTPNVVGVRTSGGDELRADLVVDMAGRRSPLPRLLEAAGARPPLEELEDSGFVYYGRHYRSPEGTRPFAFGPPLMHLGTISALTLPADNATWAVVIVTSAKDKELFGLRDTDRWENLVRALPLVAHWLEGEPIEERIVTMAKIEDRKRFLVRDGIPVATGVVAVADAWACSNPSLGRGASIGMLHGLVLRDTLRSVGIDDAHEFALAFAEATSETAEPWFDWTRRADRHRLAEIDAGIDGAEYRPADSRWELEQALAVAAGKDPDLIRLNIRAAMVLELPDPFLTDSSSIEKINELGGAWRDEPIVAPSRQEIVSIASE